jgi:hypothetical protein
MHYFEHALFKPEACARPRRRWFGERIYAPSGEPERPWRREIPSEWRARRDASYPIRRLEGSHRKSPWGCRRVVAVAWLLIINALFVGDIEFRSCGNAPCICPPRCGGRRVAVSRQRPAQSQFQAVGDFERFFVLD